MTLFYLVRGKFLCFCFFLKKITLFFVSLKYAIFCVNFADLDDTLYPLSSGIARECGQNIKGDFLLSIKISCATSHTSIKALRLTFLVDYMVEKLGIDKSKILELSNSLYKNYGTTMAGLRVNLASLFYFN